MLVFAPLAILFVSAQAQSVTSAASSLSSACQNAALGLTSSGFGTCSNLGGLLGVLSASGSIITPFNTFLQGACSQTCSSSVLATASSQVQTGCATDLASANPVAEILNTLVSNYTQVTGLACLQASSNATFCLTNLLSGIQNSTGTPITLNSITSLISGNGLASMLNSLPASTLCTDCAHGIVTKAQVLVPASSASTLNGDVSGKCGASFVDGKVPSTVRPYSNSSNSSGSAVTSSSLSAGESVGVQRVFAVSVVGAAAFAGSFLL